jgi:hypothetical protein
MFKVVSFLFKNHVFGHELEMGNEWIEKKLKKTIISPLNRYFNQISVNNSEIFVQVDMKLVFNYVIWWNKLLD